MDWITWYSRLKRMAGSRVKKPANKQIIETKMWLQQFVSLVLELDVFFVGLHCSLAELERREIQRGNRRKGEAHLDFQTVHSITAYDLELNSENSLEENVSLLIQAWKDRKRPSALDRIIQEII